MSTTLEPKTPQGPIPAISIPDSWDYPRLVYVAPYFSTVPLAELIQPAVLEAIESELPGLVPPYVQDAANTAVAQQAVMLTGSTMSGPLYLNPVLPTQPSQAASMSYVDMMIATAGVPEVPTVPVGQTWARQTGQWVPVDPSGGNFLPITGGTMQGQINMSGNGITNLPAVPQMPNGAASAQWVLNQIAASSLYQGTYTPETNLPDLTLPGTHQNGFTWIVVTSNTSGVVISAPIPGLQGLTVYNGDNLIYSAMVGQFQIVRSGGLSLGEAEALFLPFTGGQMSGNLMLNADATSAMQATTLQQVQALASFPEAPTGGQVYGRQGLTASWQPVLPLGGGILTGTLTLAANAVTALQAVPLQQLNSTLGAFVPLIGNATITGPLTMSGAGANLTLNSNAAANLQAVPLQQLTSTLTSYLSTTQAAAIYAPIASPTFTGTVTIPAGASIAGYLPLAGGTISGALTVAGAGGLTVDANLQVNGQGNFNGQVIGYELTATGGNMRIDKGAATNAGLFLNDGLSDRAAFAFITATGFTQMLDLFSGGEIHITPTGDFYLNNATGNAYKPGGGAWTASSDRRIKTVVADYQPGLAEICAVQPVEYVFKGNDSPLAEPTPYPTSPHRGAAEAGTRFVGFVADDLMSVFPDMVHETSGYIDGEAVTDLKHVDVSNMVFALCNAVKQLNVRLEALEAAR